MSLKDRFDLVIFDWAGTMVDFGCRAPVIALMEAFRRHGVALTDTQARRDMGKAKADHVRALLLDPAVAQAWRAANGSLDIEAAGRSCGIRRRTPRDSSTARVRPSMRCERRVCASPRRPATRAT